MTEILFIVFIAFLLFGTEKLPEVLRGLGKGYKEFQKATDQIKEEISKVTNDIKDETTNIKEEVNNVKNNIKEDLKDNTKDTGNRAG
jgi:sec-independent protein translocase protein TatA